MMITVLEWEWFPDVPQVPGQPDGRRVAPAQLGADQVALVDDLTDAHVVPRVLLVPRVDLLLDLDVEREAHERGLLGDGREKRVGRSSSRGRGRRRSGIVVDDVVVVEARGCEFVVSLLLALAAEEVPEAGHLVWFG